MKMRIGIRIMVAVMTIIMLVLVVMMALAMALVGNATSPDNDNYTFTFTLSVKGTKAAEGPEVRVYDNAATTNNGSAGYDFASCMRNNVAIPKFATVALPAVSVLCLFLYFNRRERNFKGV